MGEEPPYKREPWSCIFNFHFSESETFHPRTFGHHASLKDVYHFIHRRGTPLYTGSLKLYIYHSLFSKRIFSPSYTWPPIIVKRRVSLHSWEGNPLINGNPKLVLVYYALSRKRNFSQSYSWLPIIVKGWVSYHSWEGRAYSWKAFIIILWPIFVLKDNFWECH